MKTILIPTDFSSVATHAMYYAAKIAAFTKAKIILFHNVEIPVALLDTPAVMSPDPELIELNIVKLNKQIEQLRRDGNFWFGVDAVCLAGDFTFNMNNLVLENKVDLIVMGTKGANNFVQRLTGTVSASYLPEAICPVLVVAENAVLKLPQHIAYAADFENDEDISLAQLMAFAGKLKADKTLVNIKSEEQLNTITDEQILSEIQQQFPLEVLNICQIKEADVVRGLEEFVQQNGMDILAVAIREHNFMDRLFHSSVTRKLAYGAAVPLLAFPAKPYNLAPVKKKVKFEIG